MTDLFQAAHSFELIAAVWGVMAACPQHTFQVLTKRPERTREFFSWAEEQGEELRDAVGVEPPSGSAIPSAMAMLTPSRPDGNELRQAYFAPWPLPNVWLGTSAEDQQRYDERVVPLVMAPASLRFLSLEPLLGPINLRLHEMEGQISWVIVGGESGHGARPMHPAWVRSVRDQCTAAGVAFFFKQWGEWAEGDLNRRWIGLANDGALPVHHPALEVVQMSPVGKGRAGRLLDGRTWDEMPEVPRV
jgi:protein gp37